MTMIRRRDLISIAALAPLAGMPHGQASAAEGEALQFGKAVPFDTGILRDTAKDLAARPYAPPEQVPQAWRDLSYDMYRSIWFAERHALWRGTGRPVEVDFFAAGYLFNYPAIIHAVEGGSARRLRFDLDMFDKTDRFPAINPEGMGFSGFRLRGELEKKGIFQEYTVFQGASYFRALGRGQVYGLSARGLSLGTGRPEGEEFPFFREFWIETPEPGAKDIIVHALLDSPSVAGAYSFTITKGAQTRIEVRCTLFPRVDLTAAGIAPGTSMFLFDQTNPARFDDFRDAVHDSDGLLMVNGAGEQIWRPLSNPPELGVSYFTDSGSRGFGLMQRTRGADDFGDLEAHYERRPSLWVEPLEDWGPGFVVLVEIPADKETLDNIVAFWQPSEPLRAGEAHSFAYRLHWGDADPTGDAYAKVIETRSGQRVFEPGRIFTVDFEEHPGLGTDPARVTAQVQSRNGDVSKPTLQFNPATGGMRLAFTLLTSREEQPEIRAQLHREGQRVSEVWLYRWSG